jgi:hypothetical protein
VGGGSLGALIETLSSSVTQRLKPQLKDDMIKPVAIHRSHPMESKMRRNASVLGDPIPARTPRVRTDIFDPLTTHQTLPVAVIPL